jgi:hypothetical protein
MKKMISVLVMNIRYDLEGDLDKVITKLQSFQKSGVKRSIDISLGYDDSIVVELAEERLETDKEEEAREKREAEFAIRNAEMERRQFKRLKEKYGDK